MSVGGRTRAQVRATTLRRSTAEGSPTPERLRTAGRRQRLLRSAWLAVLGASLVAFGAAPASAATYPPTPPPSPGTGVLGTKTGVVSNSGLPHTGFDPSMLLIAGCALVLAGVAFLVILRLQIAASRR